MSEPSSKIVAECWTCAHAVERPRFDPHPFIGVTGQPEPLSEGRAHFHRAFGHDVRPVKVSR